MRENRQGCDGRTAPDGRYFLDLITPIIAELKIFANYDGPYGYGVRYGQRPVPKTHIEIFPAAAAQEIIFASDGYPEVFGTLAQRRKPN